MTAPTAAIVNIFTQDNVTLQDAFQFGTPGDTSWSLVGMSFTMEVKASRDDVTPLIELTSGAGQIIVDDVVQRVVHLNVPDTAIQASLPVATYVYDFIMYDTSVPPIRTVLMQGRLNVSKGVTED
jgi:hypothetical protein